MRTDVGTLVRRGEAALAVCDWATAERCFDAAAAIEESAAVLDGLGQALYWQGDHARALALRERAYAACYTAGEHRRAALVACQLSLLHWLIYGNAAASNGWLRQAERMAESAGDCRESAWVALYLATGVDDLDERARRLEAVRAAARRHHDTGLEYDALVAHGHVHIAQGQVAEGMALIDEAVAATAGGVVSDPWAVAEILCGLFDACETVGDVPRAEQWLAAVDGYVQRTGELPVAGICRMHFGGILIAAGRWADAEDELRSALDIYDDAYRGTRFQPLLRLAELRLRQGRLEEAAQLLEGLEDRDEAATPRVRLHLERGEAELACATAERTLVRRGRGVPSAPLLALQVQAQVACGQLPAAADAAQALSDLAEACRLPSVRGLAAWSGARVAAAQQADATGQQADAAGRLDDAAGRLLGEALACFVAAALPWELASARLELAWWTAASQPQVAVAEARAALAGFQTLGATPRADAAAALLRRLGDRSRPTPRSTGTLTRRESEVLDLLAEGLPNAEIAQRLFISPRTAEHHVGNILTKLGLSNRTEAAAYAVRTQTGPLR